MHSVHHVHVLVHYYHPLNPSEGTMTSHCIHVLAFYRITLSAFVYYLYLVLEGFVEIAKLEKKFQ